MWEKQHTDPDARSAVRICILLFHERVVADDKVAGQSFPWKELLSPSALSGEGESPWNTIAGNATDHPQGRGRPDE